MHFITGALPWGFLAPVMAWGHHGSRLSFMVDYAKYHLNLNLLLAKSSFLATIHGIGQIIGVLTVLPLSDYPGRKRTVFISNAIITGVYHHAFFINMLMAVVATVLMCFVRPRLSGSGLPWRDWF